MSHRPHNPFNKRDVENYREELALDRQEKEMALERYYAEKDLADDESEEESGIGSACLTHVEPRDRY